MMLQCEAEPGTWHHQPMTAKHHASIKQTVQKTTKGLRNIIGHLTSSFDDSKSSVRPQATE